MKKLLFIALMLSLPFALTRLTHGFRLSKLQLDFPANPKWEAAPPDTLREILDQPFHYIGKGMQSFVFASQDGGYVLKLFRFDKKKDKQKYLVLFDSCKLAYDHLQTETGLLYVHINTTQNTLPSIRCQDSLGRSFLIPLDSYRFVIQRKGVEFEKTLLEARNDPEKMKTRLNQWFDLIQHRAAKKIWNKDPSLTRNFGFLENAAIEFDFGSYRIDSKITSSEEIARYTQKMRRWLNKNAPEWLTYLDFLQTSFEARADSPQLSQDNR